MQGTEALDLTRVAGVMQLGGQGVVALQRLLEVLAHGHDEAPGVHPRDSRANALILGDELGVERAERADVVLPLEARDADGGDGEGDDHQRDQHPAALHDAGECALDASCELQVQLGGTGRARQERRQENAGKDQRRGHADAGEDGHLPDAREARPRQTREPDDGGGRAEDEPGEERAQGVPRRVAALEGVVIHQVRDVVEGDADQCGAEREGQAMDRTEDQAADGDRHHHPADQR